MVVGCERPLASCKRRADQMCAAGASPAIKRYRDTCEVDVPQPQQEPSVFVLGDEGGLWHVDGLLELLAGALCAALGADPSSLSLSPDDCLAATEILAAQQLGKEAASDARPPPLSRAASQLTEANLCCRTERSASAAEDDEDDRASVASLSAWVVGTPRRRGSEVGTLLTGGSPRTPSSSSLQPGPFSAPMPPAFSFTTVLQDGPGSRPTPTSGGGTGLLDGSDPRWPRRRLSTGGGRQ
ncbi:hypothetical protein TSOC_010683 [Tetrabaena socialis]|uniref:Uncharacterized protein n=1 Tax=Tetrabaena socialis TaxID=47790 RepID=A0A2J7ZSP6_9CHLO|nr:hypothetical protein TSOC_010683 [Tetrabaena socialis]|eukprot:PNH03278.1 hypothetical protein TSOC_010683 [Tetrabaena socialis]